MEFFFFQAEDGIRDYDVTGVQTCALPILEKVWVWEGRWPGDARKRLLVVREDEAGDFKYSLTNLPSTQSWKRLAYVQNQRFWIEHAFHEAKSQLGMAQYQVRVWKGWHHHMALVALATVFMLREKRSEEHTSELQSRRNLVCRLLLEKKKLQY